MLYVLFGECMSLNVQHSSALTVGGLSEREREREREGEREREKRGII